MPFFSARTQTAPENRPAIGLHGSCCQYTRHHNLGSSSLGKWIPFHTGTHTLYSWAWVSSSLGKWIPFHTGTHTPDSLGPPGRNCPGNGLHCAPDAHKPVYEGGLVEADLRQ